MTVLTNKGGLADTNCVVVADDSTRQAVMFDAPDHTTGPLLDEIAQRGWDLAGLWLTHGHFDHFADHAVVTARYPAAGVLIHPADAPKVEQPGPQLRMFRLPLQIPPLKPSGFLADGQRLSIGGLELVVIHTPGHAPGHVCFHFPGERLLIGGDLIIGGSIGRTDFPDASWPDMQTSLRRILTLPDETRLIGGHGPETTLGEERRNNPFLQLD